MDFFKSPGIWHKVNSFQIRDSFHTYFRWQDNLWGYELIFHKKSTDFRIEIYNGWIYNILNTYVQKLDILDIYEIFHISSNCFYRHRRTILYHGKRIQNDCIFHIFCTDVRKLKHNTHKLLKYYLLLVCFMKQIKNSINFQ